MTRWARTKSAHRHEKLPSDATPWSKLKPKPEVRSFKNGSKGRPRPNEMDGNQGGGVKRKMPEFKGTNFERQLSGEKRKNPFAVAAAPSYMGARSDVHDTLAQQDSKSPKVMKIKEENNYPANKFTKEMINSPQDLSGKKKRKRNKFKKGNLASENRGDHAATQGKSLPLVNQKETGSRDNTNSWNSSNKRKIDLSQTKNTNTSQAPIEARSIKIGFGTDAAPPKKKRNKKKKLKLSDQSTNATDSSTISASAVKSELGDARKPSVAQTNNISVNRKRNKRKKNKLSGQATDAIKSAKNLDTTFTVQSEFVDTRKPSVAQTNRTNPDSLMNKKRNNRKKKKAKLSAQSTDATKSQNSDSTVTVKSELGDQETNDQKKQDKEAKKEMYRLKLLAQRKEKGITMLSDKAEKKLYSIRKALQKRGKSHDEIRNILRKERRRAELKFRKAQKTVCYRCRMEGHTVATCTTILEDDDQSMGICFRCGSTEHILKRCPVPKSDGKLPYAKCFVCQSRGHLSSGCPKNTLGVFPRGGACLLCKSVNHMKKDCPTLVKDEDGEQESFAYRVTGTESADAEFSDEVKVSTKKKAKVVTF